MLRLGSKTRERGRNFSNIQAKQRVDPIATAAIEQYKNSVSVEGTQCLYYKKVLHGLTCTCTAHTLGHTANGITDIDLPEETEEDFPLFATESDPIDTTRQSDLDLDLNDETDMNGLDLFDSSLFNNSADCGLCYRTGVIPAYIPLSCSRYVFHTQNVSAMNGYKITKKYPDVFDKLSEEGYVTFTLKIPKTFVSVGFRVYNNKEILNYVPYVDGKKITHSIIHAARGQEISIVLDHEMFTHLVFQFRLTDLVLIDLPQNQHSLDLSLFDGLATINMVATNSVPQVSSGDMVYDTLLNNYWKVTSYDHYRLRNGRVIGWNITARLIQKDESLPNLNKLIELR